MHERLAQELLRKVPIFYGLKVEEIRGILEISKLLTLPQGQVVCGYGEPSRRFCILLEGVLDVLGRDGTRVARVQPVQTVGEMELVSKRPWSATVKAASPVRLLEVGFARFDSFLDSDAGLSTRLYRNFFRVLAERLSDANDRIARYRRMYLEAVGDTAATALAEAEGSPPEQARKVRAQRAVREHVTAFYELLQRLPSEDELREGERVVAELRKEGFSDVDIEFATRWTVRNIPSARRFDMVKLTMQEALEDKWSI